MAATVHVIGAGLAGLSAAARLAQAGITVILHEAAGQAGGRCRSYHDSVLETTIDNGNHLVLSGNRATLGFLRRIGAEDRLPGPKEPVFAFADLATKQTWRLRPNMGRVPWWVFLKNRRVPATNSLDYLGIMRLLWAKPDQALSDVLDCASPLYHRLWRPLLLAALNTEPEISSAVLGGQIVRETLAAGGHACRPLVARHGLSHTFIDPALAYLEAHGSSIRFGSRLRAITFGPHRAERLHFGDDTIELGSTDSVVLAAPAWSAATLIPDLRAPEAFRAIINAHFRLKPPPDFPAMMGVVNATSEWIFCFADRVCVTISAADRLLETPREVLAELIWQEVAALGRIASAMPKWQIIKERRATFAALPTEHAKRPVAETSWENLLLAGDWTATGLPATIEGAIRSGERAASLIIDHPV